MEREREKKVDKSSIRNFSEREREKKVSSSFLREGEFKGEKEEKGE